MLELQQDSAVGQLNQSNIHLYDNDDNEEQMIRIWWCHCHPIISCFIKIQTGLTFLVLAYSGGPGSRLLNRCLSVWI